MATFNIHRPSMNHDCTTSTFWGRFCNRRAIAKPKAQMANHAVVNVASLVWREELRLKAVEDVLFGMIHAIF